LSYREVYTMTKDKGIPLVQLVQWVDSFRMELKNPTHRATRNAFDTWVKAIASDLEATGHRFDRQDFLDACHIHECPTCKE
jgi:hypothetical protein